MTITLKDFDRKTQNLEQDLAIDEGTKKAVVSTAKPAVNTLVEGQVHVDKKHLKARIKIGGEVFVWNVIRES